MKTIPYFSTPLEHTVDAIFARARVNPTTGCWDWQQALSRGYGKVRYGAKHELAHRWSYRIFNGTIPDGLRVDHMCRNRACVNPAHLRVVTPRINAIENSSSASAINAARTHCSKCGGDFTPCRTKPGWRECVPCNRRRATESYYRRKVLR